tara:strand:- start:402 stop:1019 length:618 start_codon:yes stop_codon:yes gene_type:complete
MLPYKKNLVDDFYNDNLYLNILKRKKPKGINVFFREILSEPIEITSFIRKKKAFEDIKIVLSQLLPKKFQDNIFYYTWIKDMSEICILYANIIKEKDVVFSLKSSRGCKRYHIDNVPLRLLVTYYGIGTEWLPRDACDYTAYYNGESNDKIIRIKNKSKFIDSWNIAIFKGQKINGRKKAILHRTPKEALNKKSLLMCLDSQSIT